MAKSRARYLAELLNSEGFVRSDASALAGVDGVIDLEALPVLPNSQLEHSSVSIAGHTLSLGGSLTLDTADIGEHVSYKYYTDARARAAISASGDLSYNSTTGVVSFTERTDAEVRGLISVSGSLSYDSATGVVSYTTPTTIASLSNHSTTDLSEGTNLYYTTARFDTAFSGKSTTDLSEGTNLYYTTARFDTAFSGKSTTDLSEGTNLYYTTARANTDFDTRLATKSTTNLSEGTNLYYTDARARAAVSVSGSLSYNSTTGVISYTTPTNVSSFTNDSAYITNATASLSADKITSGTLNSARIPSPVNGDWWNNGYVKVGTDGVMEVGKYLDFHTADSGGGADYDVRITAGSGTISVSGTISATGGNSTNWNTAYAWGDHSTQGYATQSYVSTAISNLVDSAPATLDTLNELAAALGDDPNFATTVSTSIGTKWTQDNTKISNWDTAYGWGNHASAGYLTSFDITTQTDSKYLRADTADQMQYNTTSGEMLTFVNATSGGKIQLGFQQNDTDGMHHRLYLKTWKGSTTASGNVDFIVRGPGGSTTSDVFALRSSDNNLSWRSNTIWNAGNDGSGSGLDADTVDGVHASSFMRNDTTNHEIRFDNEEYDFSWTAHSQINPLSLKVWNNYQQTGAPSTYGTLLDIYGQSGHAHTQIHFDANTYNMRLRYGWYGSDAWSSWATLWNSLNDGSGSGLDADLLDGVHASSFLRSDADDSFTGNLTTGADNHITFGPNTTWGSSLRVGGNGRTATGTEMASVVTTDGNLHLDAAASNNAIYLGFYAGSSGTVFGSGASSIVARMDTSGNLYKASSTTNSTATYWHSANDGSGSGLDADLLDGQHGSYYAPVSSLSNYLPLSGGVMTGSIKNNTDGAVIIESNTSEANNWLWKEAVKQWGIYYFNKGSQAGATVGGYTTVGAEVFFTGSVGNGPAMPSTWTGYQSGSILNVMLSPYNGYIYSSSTVYAGSSMVVAGNSVWHAGNDGSGSGLDADLLDGQHGSYYAPVSSLGNYLPLSGGTLTGGLTGTTANFSGKVDFQGDAAIEGGSGYGVFKGYTGNNNHLITSRGIITGSTSSPSIVGGHETTFVEYCNTDSSGFVFKRSDTGTYTEIARVTRTGITSLGNTVWHAGNDGSGSGLDADLLDGLQAADFKQDKWYSFTVGGDLDKFYPVLFTNPASNYAPDIIEIYQPSVHAKGSSHGAVGVKIGLNITGWGNLVQHLMVQEYTRSGSNIYISKLRDVDHATSRIGVWLRGGNTTYYYRSDNGANLDGVYCTDNQPYKSYDSTNDAYDMTITYTTTVEDSFFSQASHTNGMNITTGNKSALGIWGSDNDGSGSGLDADLLDGIDSGSFVRSDANDTLSGQYTFTKTDDHAIKVGTIRGTAVGSQSGEYIHMYNRVHIGGPNGWGASDAGAPTYGLSTYGGANLATATGSVTIGGNTAWHAGNDGSGSGLDADTVDGYQATRLTSVDSIVSGDWNSIFSTGTAYTSGYYQVENITSGSHSNHPTGVYTYGGVLAFRHSSSTFKLYAAHTGDLVFQTGWGNDAYSGWRRILNTSYYGAAWTSSNDGSGSGLDADLLDGQQPSALSVNYANTAGSAPANGGTATALNGSNYISRSGSSGNYNTDFNNTPAGTVRHQGDDANITNNPGGTWWFVDNYRHSNGSNYWGTQVAWGWEDNANKLAQRNITGGNWSGWVYYWNTGNDGSGSGLDADLLDGYQTASGPTANTIPVRDAAGDIAAREIVLSSGLSSSVPTVLVSMFPTTNQLVRTTPEAVRASMGAWTSGNDGSGSGLDADLLDGVQGASYARRDVYTSCDSGFQVFRNLGTATGSWEDGNHTMSLENSDAGYLTLNFHRGGYTSHNLLYTGSEFRFDQNLTSTGNITAFSDIRLKDNIEVIPDALEKVQKIRGVTFTRNDREDKEKLHTGVIAQEVETVLPEAVETGHEGIKQVAYGNMVGLLIEAIKELKAEVEDLKSQLKEK